MSLQGWLMYGDRGPIIGRWPVDIVQTRKHDLLGAGTRIVIDNGIVREARFGEWGCTIPEGSYIEGTNLCVPETWWRYHFHELLGEPYPAAKQCCWSGQLEGEQCADCPR